MDSIEDFLRNRGYADHVVRGGLPRLVEVWEDTARGIARGAPAYIEYYEFLNDVDGRCILDECLSHFAALNSREVSMRVAKADAVFREATRESAQCVWGEAVSNSRGFCAQRNWYYFRIPHQADKTWPDNLLCPEV